jgi:hypothetical protein
MIEKHHAFARHARENTKPHIKSSLVYSSRQGKMRSPVHFVPEPRKKADKRKLDFFCHANASSFAHFLCDTRIATPNRCTMANVSLPHLQ